ncbi:s-adenosyl-l-methionine-dependent methyltransferase [Seiridium cupressi]
MVFHENAQTNLEANGNSNGVTTKSSAPIGRSQVETLLDLSANLNRESFSNDGERAQAVQSLWSLITRLETPWETIARLCMGQPALGAALKVAKDLDLFEKWHSSGNAEMTGPELANLVQAEPALLTANGMLEETSINVFKPTAFSQSLLEPVFGEWLNYYYDALIPSFQTLPSWLSQNGYKEPKDPSDGVFQMAKGWKGGDLFSYYDAHPQEGASFNNIMGGVMAHQAGWLDIYPHDGIFAEFSGELTDLPPLVVDIGGNVGHDLERVRTRYPDVAAKLYLQDRADVVKLSKCPDPVNKVVYDFFTPQPVNGARIYYMHGVLHDWSDEPALKILQNQRPAMKVGYSKLIVHDHVVRESLAHPQATAYDLTMMVKVAGVERTESHWRELLKSAGFKVINIWSSPLAVQSVIEAEPAEFEGALE